jgi:hypothetical protein
MTASPRRSAGPAWPTRWRSSPAKGCGPRPSRPTPPRGCRRAGLDQPRATRGLDPDHPAVPRRPHRDLVGGRRPAARGRLGPGPAPAAAGRRGSPSIPHHCRRQTTRPPLARPCGGSGPTSTAARHDGVLAGDAAPRPRLADPMGRARTLLAGVVNRAPMSNRTDSPRPSELGVATNIWSRRSSTGALATPVTDPGPIERPADGMCRQILLPVPPNRLALVGGRLLIASRQARSVGVAMRTPAAGWERPLGCQAMPRRRRLPRRPV